MAAKTANVMARVEPSVKEQAEEITEMMGIPVSLSVPAVPVARDEMNEAAFHAMMERGLNEAMADKSHTASEAFSDLKREML